MTKRILIILGHPAHERRSFGKALAVAYQEGAREAGHAVQLVQVGQLHFDPILHEGYQSRQLPEPDLAHAQEQIRWAEHLVIVYPLWQFAIPALLKGFFERCFTPGFAYSMESANPFNAGLLRGKSVRLLQTMGMPALAYRLMFGAHGARAFCSMLRFCGLRPVKVTYFGGVEESGRRRAAYLKNAQALGRGGK